MTYEEYPVFVPSGQEQLCAVVCVPTHGIHETGITLISGNRTRPHRNSMFVRVARDLAIRGYPSIRFDHHGMGDSTGTLRWDLEKPVDTDVLAATDFLQRATDVSRVGLVSTCLGGAGAVAAASTRPDIPGVVAFSMPTLVPRVRGPRSARRRAARWLRRRAPRELLLRIPGVHRLRGKTLARPSGDSFRVVPSFKRDLAALLRRGGFARFIFGEHVPFLPGIRRCLAEVEPDLRPEERARLRLEVVRGTEFHALMSLREQDLMATEALLAVEELFGSAHAPQNPSTELEVTRDPRDGSLVGRSDAV